MKANNHEYFEEIEIAHNFSTYYASGYVGYSITECIGGSYEGYAFEILYNRELCNITINELWYYDEDTGDGVDILGQQKYREIEEIAEEVIKYKFEL
ncbi:MAG: hypothetical protein PHI32_04490 [Dysgonamonadaceae bacterium]|nr:hypothetical protein [Dysgonamonadaceae bacterium]MDD4727713.1 hypothetical protein [Dysgonamonadaceae bacterium]